MKSSRIGRFSLATIASLAMGLGMTACGGGTVAFLWVTAAKTTSNGAGDSITGYKVDDYTGNLTEMVRSPYASGGTNPVVDLLKAGGRFVYVLNAGDGTANNAGANISVFSVGGDGVLSFQQSYVPPFPTAGEVALPVYAQLDSAGAYLYILTRKAPLPATGTIPYGCNVANCGAIFVYAIAADTGRLTLVTNNNVRVNNVNITYFPTGSAPFQMRTIGGSNLVTVNSDQSVTIYSTNSTNNGQLTLAGNTLNQQTNATNISSVTAGNNYVYFTDAGTNKIFSYTLNNGVLSATIGSPFDNFYPNVKPVWTATDVKGKFVYVLNQETATCTPAQQQCNSISAFTIDSNGKLTKVSGVNNPYPVGRGATCMLQDPSYKYVYTSNATDSTVTGFEINQATGELNALRRGSTFAVTGKPTCLIASGATN